MVAVRAVVVSPLQGQRAQDGFEGLGTAAGVVCGLPAGAGLVRAALIAEVVAEAPFDRPCGQLQRPLAQTGLEGLEIDGVGGPGSYEAGDLGFDGGDELLRAGFFFNGRWAEAGPTLWSRASESCSLTSISSPVRRRRRWHSATSARSTSACRAEKERVVCLPAELKTRRK